MRKYNQGFTTTEYLAAALLDQAWHQLKPDEVPTDTVAFETAALHRAGVDWQLSEAVRQMVRFETIDLRKSMRALGPFDLVFCRNVMIYFDAETKQSILNEIYGTLFRGGWLLLGGAETAFGVEQWFERQTVGNAIVYAAR